MTAASADLRRQPPRSLLFVPADRSGELLEKARRSGADATIVDLEDAVAPERKDEARAGLAEALASSPSSAVFVRVNPVSSRWFAEDLRVIAGLPVAGIVLPKCDRPEDVRRVTTAWATETDRPLALLAMVESARGVLAAAEIASADPAVIGLALGAEDLAAQLGLRRSRLGREILYARSHVVLAAAAAERWAIDTPCLDYRRLDLVRRDARVAAALGFAGKLVIHPAQVAPVHEAFRPSAAELEQARRTLVTAEALAASGRGAGGDDGRLVDRPVVEAARRLLGRADAGSGSSGENHAGG